MQLKLLLCWLIFISGTRLRARIRKLNPICTSFRRLSTKPKNPSGCFLGRQQLSSYIYQGNRVWFVKVKPGPLFWYFFLEFDALPWVSRHFLIDIFLFILKLNRTLNKNRSQETTLLLHRYRGPTCDQISRRLATNSDCNPIPRATICQRFLIAKSHTIACEIKPTVR